MKTRSSSPSLLLSRAFKQFLEVSSFARRTHESYTEDLVSLFAQRFLFCSILPSFLLNMDLLPRRLKITSSNYLMCNQGDVIHTCLAFFTKRSTARDASYSASLPMHRYRKRYRIAKGTRLVLWPNLFHLLSVGVLAHSKISPDVFGPIFE